MTISPPPCAGLFGRLFGHSYALHVVRGAIEFPDGTTRFKGNAENFRPVVLMEHRCTRCGHLIPTAKA